MNCGVDSQQAEIAIVFLFDPELEVDGMRFDFHGSAIRSGFNGEWEGIRYRLVSCDALNFTLAACLPGDSGK